MDPVTNEVLIDRPHGEVFAYLADIAHWPEFTDHFLGYWHLTREDSYGRGAGARYRTLRRFDRFAYGDFTLYEVIPPRRIVARGRGGKFNRNRTVLVFELEPEGADATRVSLSVETLPALPTDKAMEIVLRSRAWSRRRWGKALRRLRSILEDGEERGRTVTISGGARKPATGAPIR
jgi:hypothetical protein